MWLAPSLQGLCLTYSIVSCTDPLIRLYFCRLQWSTPLKQQATPKTVCLVVFVIHNTLVDITTPHLVRPFGATLPTSLLSPAWPTSEHNGHTVQSKDSLAPMWAWSFAVCWFPLTRCPGYSARPYCCHQHSLPWFLECLPHTFCTKFRPKSFQRYEDIQLKTLWKRLVALLPHTRLRCGLPTEFTTQ